MTSWLLAAAIPVAAGFIVWWLAREPASRAHRSDLAHWIHSLAKVKRDGGSLVIVHRASRVVLRVRRTRGAGTRCTIAVEVPRASWSEDRIDAVRALMEPHGSVVLEPRDSPGTIARVEIELQDIWSEDSGLSAARLAGRLLDELGVPRDALLRVHMSGANSVRVAARSAPVLLASRHGILRRLGEKLAASGADESSEDEST